jgi:hypothetical protein
MIAQRCPGLGASSIRVPPLLRSSLDQRALSPRRDEGAELNVATWISLSRERASWVLGQYAFKTAWTKTEWSDRLWPDGDPFLGSAIWTRRLRDG